MLFENNDLDFNILNIMGITDDREKFVNAKEGFLRGNMFKNEYEPYKNYTYINLVPKNERLAKLYNIMQYSFAINDLNLYLDLNPNDVEAFKLFKSFIEEEKKAKNEYTNTYGPLELCEDLGQSYDWLNKWPWESGGNIYV